MGLSLKEYETSQKQAEKILKSEKKKMQFFNFHSCLDCKYCKTSLSGCFCDKLFSELKGFDEKLALTLSSVNSKTSCNRLYENRYS